MSIAPGNSQHISPNPPQERVALVDRLIHFLRTAPWWGVALVGILVYLALSTLSDPQRRDALGFMADRPHVSTTELFEVTLRVENPVLIVSDSALVLDLEDKRFVVLFDDLISRQEGTIQCPEDAAPDCLSQRGTVITYRNYDVPSGRTPDGTQTFQGVIDLRGFGTVDVILPDGQEIQIPGTAITASREGALSCDRRANPDCTPLSGEIVTFERPYIESHAIEVRADTTIRYPEDGYERTLRPTFIRNRREGILPCRPEDPQPCEEMTVTYAEVVDNITGIEIGRTDEVVRVRTVARQAIEVPRQRVISMEPTLVECDRDANPRCQDYEGTLVQLSGEELTGRLTFESTTHYRIVREEGGDPIRYNRREIVEEERTPPDCVDINQDPPCIIRIKLNSITLAGRITETNNGFVIESVPEKIVEVPIDEIVETARRVPDECALNNIRGCNEGIWLTILVTFLAYGIALVIGLVVGIFRVPSDPGAGIVARIIRGTLYHAATLYVEFVRGVPLLVLLFAFAFVIGPEVDKLSGPIGSFFDLLDDIEKQILGVNNYFSEAILGLAVGYGAYLAEVFRAGIQSISKGQMEAARSLGMSYAQSMRQVILPQAIRVVLPPLGNDFIAMLKDSSLIAVLALSDLFFLGRSYASTTFRYLPVFEALTLYYIIMTLLLSLLVRLIERWSKLP